MLTKELVTYWRKFRCTGCEYSSLLGVANPAEIRQISCPLCDSELEWLETKTPALGNQTKSTPPLVNADERQDLQKLLNELLPKGQQPGDFSHVTDVASRDPSMVGRIFEHHFGADEVTIDRVMTVGKRGRRRLKHLRYTINTPGGQIVRCYRMIKTGKGVIWEPFNEGEQRGSKGAIGTQ